jgi:L-asparaginase II
VHVFRERTLDVVHRGSLVVIDAAGSVVRSAGDPGRVAFFRSAAKPLQALAMVEAGGAERFGLTQAELAIICASHHGLALHRRTVRSILRRIGLTERSLKCPGIRDNCSGKHSGMLALARMLKAPVGSYLDRMHPVQVLIRRTLREVMGVAPGGMSMATDGCGAPIYAMPIRNMALGYLRLSNPELCESYVAQPPPAVRHKRIEALEKIREAMVAHPEMVCEPEYRKLLGLPIVAKTGAAGVYCVGVPGEKLALALKLDDGSGVPVRALAVAVLARLGIVSRRGAGRFFAKFPLVVRNRKNEEVGRMEILV